MTVKSDWQDRPGIQVLPDRILYRASVIGDCIKAVAALRMGYQPFAFTDDELTRFKEGHLHEEAVLSEMSHVSDRQRVIELHLTNTLIIQGSIDGLQTDYGKRKIVEIKTTNKDGMKAILQHGWETPGFIQKYKWQVSVYMIALDLELDLIVKDKESGKLWTLTAERPPHSIEEIRGRILRIEAYAKSGSLPVPCEPGANQWFCKFPYLHEHDTAEVLDDKELEQLAVQYDHAKVEETTAKNRKAELRKALKSGLGDKKKVKAGLASVTFYATHRIDYDHNKMAQDGIDLEIYKTERVQENLRVKIEEEKEEKE